MNSNDWNSIGWLEGARRLVAWIDSLPLESRIMLLIRHSHREAIEDHDAQLSTELTDLGRRMSFEMGKRLPVDRKSLFFFSFVNRCYQTADEMAKGIRETGGDVIDLNPLPLLATPDIADNNVWEELQPDGRNIAEFVNRWADGRFGDMIEGFGEYGARLLEATIGRLSEADDGVIHIHVTHDLALMAAKRTLLTRPVAMSDRDPFLGGLGVVIGDDRKMFLSSSGEEHIIP
ncbi:MAG: histidine phosphatase family protein [Candidatus Thorarchaeota archaeon]|nr:MAG: histidine phosphatase family protein [Candidatus Thorarchaeota archaeon]